MGRGAASAASTQLSNASDKRHTLPRLSDLIPLLRESIRSPLHHTSHHLCVGAAVSVGLLHKLRGAPSSERNAVLTPPHLDIAMLSTFSGHGKHGLRLADLAASVTFRYIRRRLPILCGQLAPSSPSSASSASASALGSFHHDSHPTHSMERLVDDALVDAYSAVDATVWARSSAVSATVVLLQRSTLVLGACGLPTVMFVLRRNGRYTLQLISGRAMHSRASTLPSFHSNLSKEDDVTDSDDLSASFDNHPVTSPHLQARFSLPSPRSSSTTGNLINSTSTTSDSENVQGACLVPTIRTFNISPRHTHVVISTMRLWSGDTEIAPRELSDVFATKGDRDVIDLSEDLMKAAFGPSGSTHDCSILVARLRR